MKGGIAVRESVVFVILGGIVFLIGWGLSYAGESAAGGLCEALGGLMFGIGVLLEFFSFGRHLMAIKAVLEKLANEGFYSSRAEPN